jgi:putative endonuclease
MRPSPDRSIPGGSSLTTVSTGRWAESIAACYLSLCGFRVLARNYRDGPRELDLLALQGTWAVVVEVRFRSSGDRGRPDETVHHRKRMQILRAGRAWWLAEGRRFGALRFDLVTIELAPRGMRLRHFPYFLNPEQAGMR